MMTMSRCVTAAPNVSISVQWTFENLRDWTIETSLSNGDAYCWCEDHRDACGTMWLNRGLVRKLKSL